MAKVYANLCEKGVRNFNTVPDNLKAQVKAIIEADGYRIKKDGTVEKLPIEQTEEASQND